MALTMLAKIEIVRNVKVDGALPGWASSYFRGGKLEFENLKASHEHLCVDSGWHTHIQPMIEEISSIKMFNEENE